MNIIYLAIIATLPTVTSWTLPMWFAPIWTVPIHIVTYIISSTLTTSRFTITTIEIWGTLYIQNKTKHVKCFYMFLQNQLHVTNCVTSCTDPFRLLYKRRFTCLKHISIEKQCSRLYV